jgi:hypothetical protein
MERFRIMEYEELLSLLDIDSGNGLAYFEQYAELVECEDYIAPEALSQIFEEVESDALAELTDGYFEELLESVPDEEAELYTLLQTIGRALSGLALMPEHDEATANYADEFLKFRTWYAFESEVRCESVDPDDTADESDETVVTLMQALALYRAQHLSDEEYVFDFSDALDYPIEEYAVMLENLPEEEEPEEAYDDHDDM